MSAPHTPGPWHSCLVSERTWHVGVYDATGTQVALCKVASALHGPRRDADARLIAAAPELLAALRECADYLDCIPESAAGGDDDAMRLTRFARAAIAEAVQS